MQLAKWGNSLAIRIPASVVKALDLHEGDEIEIHVEGERSFAIDKKPSRLKLLERLRAMRGAVPKDFSFDRLEAQQRG